MGIIRRPPASTAAFALAATTAFLSRPSSVEAWSSFHGSSLRLENASASANRNQRSHPSGAGRRGILHMRKQKASDKRTRRLQRSGALLEEGSLGSAPVPLGSTASPMDAAAWKQRKIRNAFPSASSASGTTGTSSDAPVNRGRGRSRKRSQLYSRLATYNNDFVALLTAEYRAEVRIYMYMQQEIPTSRHSKILARCQKCQWARHQRNPCDASMLECNYLPVYISNPFTYSSIPIFFPRLCVT